ncbi:MAG: VWA domain-containing protein [Acetobacteraceae bacterium]
MTVPIWFLSPQYLWLLLALPVAAGFYVLLLNRRKKAAVRYGNFGMLKRAVGASGRARRHIPPALFLAALTLLIIGIARPSAVMTSSLHKSTIILAMDVSLSMRATDVKPSRIRAMRTAAKQFVTRQPGGVLVGLVAFSDDAFLIQTPTSDHAALDSSISRLQVQFRTAIGSAILTGLSALFPHEDFGVSPFDTARTYFRRGLNGFGGAGPYGGGGSNGGGAPLGFRPSKNFVPVPPGSDHAAVIILLTDGCSNIGPDPLYAAHIAAEHGVRIYTVGFGTDHGTLMNFRGWRMPARLCQEPLKQIADLTRAKYFRATSAQQLQTVYKLLSKSIVVETKQTEITSLFAAGAALFALLAVALSVLWFSRIL